MFDYLYSVAYERTCGVRTEAAFRLVVIIIFHESHTMQEHEDFENGLTCGFTRPTSTTKSRAVGCLQKLTLGDYAHRTLDDVEQDVEEPTHANTFSGICYNSKESLWGLSDLLRPNILKKVRRTVCKYCELEELLALSWLPFYQDSPKSGMSYS